MYKFWNGYPKPNYGEEVKLCYMDTDSFIVYVKADDIYKDIAENSEKDLALQITKQASRYLKDKTKKSLD